MVQKRSIFITIGFFAGVLIFLNVTLKHLESSSSIMTTPTTEDMQGLQTSPHIQKNSVDALCGKDGLTYRWRVEGATNPLAMKLCAGRTCVPVSRDGVYFVGSFQHPPSDNVTARWMWRDVDWESQQSRNETTTVDFQWTGCSVDETFVDKVVCSWSSATPHNVTTDSKQARPNPPVQLKSVLTEYRYYVGDSTMKRFYDSELLRCRHRGSVVPQGKLHQDASTTCDGVLTKYIWSAGFDDTSLRINEIPPSDSTLVLTDTGHNYINLGDADFESFVSRLSRSISRFKLGFVLEPPAMNTSWWDKRNRCMRNNVVVQKRIHQIEKYVHSDRIVSTFWRTLGSGKQYDGIHFTQDVYEDMLNDLWLLASKRT